MQLLCSHCGTPLDAVDVGKLSHDVRVGCSTCIARLREQGEFIKMFDEFQTWRQQSRQEPSA